MTNKYFDIVLLTQKEYLNPTLIDSYIENILLEDKLLTCALEEIGLKVTRTNWDNNEFDWGKTRFALFRATWDYFHRFNEFHLWLKQRKQKIEFINPYNVISWNMNKNYLATLQEKGVNIPPTLFLKQGTSTSLRLLLQQSGWDKAILKPAIAGGARHTYLLTRQNVANYEDNFQQLISAEAMLLQQFQESITTEGEVSYMIFAGKYSHSVLKKAKKGDFRVQDDFGGTVHTHTASKDERVFVERVIELCGQSPVYARVDVMLDNHNQLCVSELELIEPELWLRKDAHSPKAMADAVVKYCINKE